MSALLGAMAAPFRAYVTGLLQTYLSTYIKDIQLEGAARRGSSGTSRALAVAFAFSGRSESLAPGHGGTLL